MNRDAELIEIIRTRLKNCVTSGTEYYTYGNIPQKKYTGAVRNYASGVAYDDVLGLVDTTVFGGGERGMLLTREGIYLKEIMTNPVYCDYRTCPQMSLPGNAYFDTDQLFQMFLELSDVVSRAEDEEFVDSMELSADTEEEESEGLLETFVHEFGKIFSEKRKQEHNEFLEQVESLRSSVKDIRDSFQEFLTDYDDFETYQEIIEKISVITLMACVCAKDREACLAMTETYDESWDDLMELIASMEDTLDEILEDCDTEGAEPLTRTFKRFQAKMNTIFDELRGILEDLEDDDAEIEDYDWESLYERSQSAVKTVRKKLSIVINVLNEALEEEYDD